MTFLPRQEPRPLDLATPAGWQATGLFVGNGAMALEVALLEAPLEPPAATLKELQRSRVGRRATPVLVVALWGDERAAICGSWGDDLIAYTKADRGQVERICNAALSARDRHSAIRFLNQAFEQLDPERISGLRNQGLFAMHELRTGVRARRDWAEALAKGISLLGVRGRQLVEGLGFKVQQMPGPASVLIARGTKVAVAVFLERPDEIEPTGPLFDGVSPVSYALAKADQENLDYVVVSAGSTLRVYPVKPGVGTGRRGRTETYIELNLDLLRDDDAAYLWLLASGDALAPGGSFVDILDKSGEYAADLSVRLRDRVYLEVVPQIAKALVRARRLRNPTAAKLAETYDMALRVLFRLLFVAYAEDKELLPLHTNARYREHSLKTMARRLLEAQRSGVRLEREDFYWNEVQQLWKAVDKGNREWGVPAYNGGLFTSDEADSATGAALATLSLPDSTFAPALAALLLDDTEDEGIGPIDFRSLGVREFGTIYEGLLESELSVAETDLTVHPKTGAYSPATRKDDVQVHEGEVYLHNASGARKSSGAYYTKAFAVEHLLDSALEPALDDHLARLDAMYDDREAGDRFFEFRVADIAMGSGHFLVAAVDRIERRLSNYLPKRPLAGVMDELERLRVAAREALGEEYAGDAIEDTQLLRRQIARRCIFGVDLNPMAVELARLSIWIHTFVPGLPLSFLDHNLVVGNSLVGIATFEEANEILAGSGDLFSFTAAERLARAREPMQKLARLADATAAEVKQAKKLYEQARTRIQGEEALLTILTASRIDDDLKAEVDQGNVATRLETQGDVFSDRLVRKAEKALRGLDALHFPIVFPQVFLGNRGGFDVIIGNPPWEEATVEEDAFWARHFPGLRSRPQREQETLKARYRESRPDLKEQLDQETAQSKALRQVLTRGPFPGMGTGDPDLYKAFCWRFWTLVAAEGGRIGVVLPRSALSAKGSTHFRTEVFARARNADITMLLNNRQWFFDDVHPQYTIGLVAIERGSADRPAVALRGPYPTLERYQAGRIKEPSRFFGSEVSDWNDTSSLPLLPTDESLAVFAQLRKAPRLDLNIPGSWRARPQRELDATNDKHHMDLDSERRPKGYWPVYKGESFDLWNPDTGTYYAWADPDTLLPVLQRKRATSARSERSAYSEFDRAWLANPRTLPCWRPRIAFRDITRATDTRTVRAALIPGKVFLANTAPHVLFPRGDARDTAFLLGCLSSITLDWYARRFVETHLSFFVLNPIPVPRPDYQNPMRTKIISLAGRLAAHDDRYGDWAERLGVDCGPVPLDEKADMVAQLDAAVALLYGLTDRQLTHLFETFHEGWDCEARLEQTLRHLKALKGLA